MFEIALSTLSFHALATLVLVAVATISAVASNNRSPLRWPEVDPAPRLIHSSPYSPSELRGPESTVQSDDDYSAAA